MARALQITVQMLDVVYLMPRCESRPLRVCWLYMPPCPVFLVTRVSSVLTWLVKEAEGSPLEPPEFMTCTR